MRIILGLDNSKIHLSTNTGGKEEMLRCREMMLDKERLLEVLVPFRRLICLDLGVQNEE